MISQTAENKYLITLTEINLDNAMQLLSQGENILNSKKEIEDTLDTFNYAFEKLLDDLFRDTAWDVSSDVTVLENMLAQEGLTKKKL